MSRAKSLTMHCAVVTVWTADLVAGVSPMWLRAIGVAFLILSSLAVASLLGHRHV